MKIFKEYLGVSSLEERVAVLEQRIERHEHVLKVIAEALRKNSSSVVELSQYLRKIVDIATNEIKSKKENEDDIFH